MVVAEGHALVCSPWCCSGCDRFWGSSKNGKQGKLAEPQSRFLVFLEVVQPPSLLGLDAADTFLDADDLVVSPPFLRGLAGAGVGAEEADPDGALGDFDLL